MLDVVPSKQVIHGDGTEDTQLVILSPRGYQPLVWPLTQSHVPPSD